MFALSDNLTIPLCPPPVVDTSLVELSSKQPCGGGYFSHLVGISAIYQIINLINGKSYVGKTNNLGRRFKEHRCKRKSTCYTIALAFKKYGKHNFKFVVLELCELDKLAEREIFWVEKLKPEYNRTSGGDGTSGHPVSERTRKILSRRGKEQWAAMSPEAKSRVISNFKPPQKGHQLSYETRRKISKTLTGRPLNRVLSAEARFKIGQSTAMSNRINKNRSNPVVQIHPQWGVMNYFPSFQMAAQETGVSAWSIGQVISSKRGRKRAGGFLWKDFKINAGTKYEPQKHEH